MLAVKSGRSSSGQRAGLSHTAAATVGLAAFPGRSRAQSPNETVNVAIIGLREADVEPAWQELGGMPALMTGNVIRSIRSCPGTEFCKRARQDSLAVGLTLDRRY